MTGKTPREFARRMMEHLREKGKDSYAKGDIISMMNEISTAPDYETPDPYDTCRGPFVAKELRRGDVFISTFAGGKVRPWVTLTVQREVVTALAMSSGDKIPNMVKSQCRFWPSSWIAPTVSQWPLEIALQQVTRPYTNLEHLGEIEQHVGNVLGLEVSLSANQEVAEE